MCCNLLGVGFLKSFNCFVVLFELFDLLFKFLAPVVETLLQIHHLKLHLFKLLLMRLLHLLFLLLDLRFVGFESILGFVLFSQVSSFNLAYFFLPVVPFLSSLQRVFLFCNHSIGSD
jgi:hypothetical protein